MSGVFERFHPAVLFSYFLGMAVLAMLLFHPLFILLSFAASTAVGLLCAGRRAMERALLFTLPLAVAVTLLNPVVNIAGQTELFTWLFGQPFTLEALAYGGCAGLLLASVALWFVSYNKAVPPEKSLYLFSFLAPSAAMLVTMAQRMVPLFLRRAAAVRDAQRMLLSPPAKTHGKRARARAGAARELSALLTWSMEEGLDTADSMKARGYGCTRRSFYAAYRFTRRDAAALAAVLCLLCVCGMCFAARVRFDFYPYFDSVSFGAAGRAAVCAYAALAVLPFAARLWEARLCRF